MPGPATLAALSIAPQHIRRPSSKSQWAKMSNANRFTQINCARNHIWPVYFWWTHPSPEPRAEPLAESFHLVIYFYCIFLSILINSNPKSINLCGEMFGNPPFPFAPPSHIPPSFIRTHSSFIFVQLNGVTSVGCCSTLNGFDCNPRQR